MRYAIVIPDGAADTPRPELDNRTPLEAAEMPALTALVGEGSVLAARTVPPQMKPGSDVACLSVLGYDPAKVYTGRAPLEAAAMGISLGPGQAVFRANTVTIRDGVMADYAGGHIRTPEAAALVNRVNDALDIPGVRLQPGVQYRHACVLDDIADAIPETTPPHDILDQSIAEHLPRGPKADRLNAVMDRARALLADAPENAARLENDQAPITDLWLWGGGVMPRLETYADRYGLTGGLVSAVHLLKGIGTLAGLEIIDVPGATAYYDTDYAAKGRAALDCLQRLPFVAVHIEAPDEAGHNGDTTEKVRALERIDEHILAPLLDEGVRSGDLRLLVMPDHPTPIELRTHSAEPVPACLWGPGIRPSGGRRFSEDSALRSGVCVPAHTLLSTLIGASPS